MAISSIWTMRGVVLLAAILVWANVYAFTDKVQEIQAPLLIEGLNSGLAFDQPVTTVKAVVAGKSSLVGRLNQENFNFYLDASSAVSGTEAAYEVKLKQIPNGIKLIRWEPNQIRLTASAVTTKDVPVEVLTTGSTPDNLLVQNITVSPATVRLSSSSSILAGINKAYVYVDLNNKKASFTADGRVVTQDSSGSTIQNVISNPAIVRTSIEIVQGIPFKHVGIKPTISDQVPAGYWIEQIELTPSVVMVKGRQSLLKDLAFVPTTNLKVGGRTSSFTDQVAVDLPNGLEIIGDNLIQVKVTIGLQGNVRQFDISPKFLNLNSDYSISSINPASVKVVVTGQEDKLKNLTKNDIVLNLDLSSVITGPNLVELSPAQISVPEGIRVESINVNRLEIIVSKQ